MPLVFDGKDMRAYEDWERRKARMTKRSWVFIALWLFLAAAVAADRFLGLEIGIDRVVAPLQSI